MKEKKPTYNQLETKLADAIQMIETIEDGQADAIVSKKNIMVLRLREAEQALRESEQRYRGFVEKNPSAVFCVDLQGNFTEVNPAACEMSGYSEKELLKKKWQDLCDPANLDEAKKGFKDVLKGKSSKIRIAMIAKNGHCILLNLIGGPLVIHNKVQGAFVIAHNITDMIKTEENLRIHQAELETQNEQRRMAQAEIEQARQQYTELFDFAPVGYFVIEKNGVIEQVNLTGAAMIGIERNLLMNKPLDLYIAREDKDSFYLNRRMVFDKSAKKRLEVKLQTRDREFYAELLMEPITDAEDTVTRCRIAMVDVTARRNAEKLLYDSRRQLQLLIQSGRVGTWDWDLRTNKVTWNHILYDMLNLPPNDKGITANTFFERIHPEDRDRVDKNVRNTLKQGGEFKDEFRIIRFDNQIRWLVGRGRVHLDPSGKAIRITGVNFDVTEQKQTEQALRESEQRLRLALEAAYLISFEWDIQKNEVRRLMSFEPSLKPTDAKSPETFEHMLKMIHPEDRQMFKDKVDAAMKTKDGQYENEFRIVREDGKTLWLYERGKIEYDEKGEPLKLIGLSQDITERKQGEQNVHAQAVFLRNIIDSLSHPFYVLDAEDYTVKLANRAAVEAAELKEDTTCYALTHRKNQPCHSDEHPCPIEIIKKTKQPAEVEHIHYDRDGIRRIVELRAHPIFDEDGNVSKIIEYSWDITDRKEAERALRQSREDLARAQQVGSIGSWRLDVRKNKLTWSQENHRIFGVPKGQEMTYETFFSRVHPDDRDYVDTRWKAALTGEPYDLEHRIVVDGQIKWVREKAYLEFDDEGELIGGFGITQDITKQRETEQAVRESEQRLRLAAQAARFGTYDADLVKGKLFWSNEMRQILGLPIDTPTPPPGQVPDFVHPDDRQTVKEMFERAYDPKGNGKIQHEHRIIRPDGTVRWVLIKGQVEYANHNGQRKPVRSTGIMMDITERKDIEKTITNLAKFPGENPFPVLRLDKDGTILYSNQAGKILRDQWNTKTGEQAPEKWRYKIQAALKYKNLLIEDIQCNEQIFLLAIAPVPEGDYVNIYGSDITKQIRIEKALEESNRTLEQRVLKRTEELKNYVEELNKTKNSLLQAHRIARLGNWEWDLKDNTVWWSEEVYKLFGFESEDYEPSYEKYLTCVHPDDVELVHQAFEKTVQGSGTYSVEHRIVRSDGSECVVQQRAEVIRNVSGEPIQMIGTIQDITESRRKEQQLKEQSLRLKSQAELLDLAHDTIIVHDLDGKIIFWNKGAERAYGWTGKEAIGQLTHELLQTTFSEPLLKIISAVSTQGHWEGELRHITKDGRKVIVESRWAIQKNENNEPSTILEIDRDITDRVQAQKETEDARVYAESIIETIEEAILVLNADLKVISANKTFYEIFKLKPDAVIGKYVYELAEGHWRSPEFIKLLEGVLPENKTINNYEVEYAGKEGIINLLLNAKKIYEDRKHKRRILLAFHDITSQKLQENALKELTEELLLAEEHQRQQVATALHDSIGQMLAFSKRELLSLMKEPQLKDDPRLKKVLEQIKKSVRQSRELTSDLSSPTLHTFGIGAAIEELAEQFEKEHSIHCSCNFNEEQIKPVEKKVELLLYRAVKELLCNIAKHARAKNVIIDVRNDDNLMELTVTDDGKGFNTARLHNNDGKKKSFGLFSIEQRLTNVGGSFSIHSEKKKGTNVTLTVPLKTE